MSSDISRARLVLDPGVRFAELEARLENGGWIRRPSTTTLPPILPGEPELAQWRSQSDVLLTYTFNPVVHLRVLEIFGAAATSQRDVLSSTLPTVSLQDLERGLEADDPRMVLRAIMAAGELDASDLAERIGLLAAHRERVVAESAARVHLDLLHTRASALAATDRAAELAIALGAICGNATPLLATLPEAEPDEILGLRPTEPDYDALFSPDLAGRLFEHYEPLWNQPPRVSPGPARRELRVHACPASLLGSENSFSRPFPGGYRAVAPLLRPDSVWLCWKYCAPGSQSGLAFDGLVHVNGDWVWFPKVYDAMMRAAGVKRSDA